MKNTAKIAISALTAILMTATPAYAQYGSGSTPTPKQCVIDDVKVRATTQTKFSDNLDANAYLFKEGDLVEYSVVIENNGTETKNDVSVSFVLPSCSALVFGPNQKDVKENKLTWNISELKAKESKTYTVRTKITEKCLVKKLVATSSAVCKEGGSSTDSSTVYVGKPTAPQTGAEDIFVKTALVVAMAAAGYALRKSARGY